MSASRRDRRRPYCLVALATLATVLSLLVVVSPTSAVADPPPNPTNTQLDNAQARKDALAGSVGDLSARVATLQTQLQQMQAKQELAEQKLAYAISKLEQAKHAATVAKAAVGTAETEVHTAQNQFVEYAQSVYMSGGIGGTTGALLTASDPNALLQRSSLQYYQAAHQLSAVSNLQRATVAKSNADAAARSAVQLQTTATANAANAKQQADQAVANTRTQTAQVRSSLAASQNALELARTQLATLNGQRAQYLAYQAEQARLAREQAAREAAARAEAERQAQLLAAQQAAQQAQQSGNNGGGHSAPPPVYSPPPSPSGGSWTAARGQQAVNRAVSYLGTMYAWAGGNASGPTYGVCAGDGAFNDCNISGFDCSGLTIYAWAPYLIMDHYAATQYTQAGSYHPSSSNFMPGDLLFWSSDGTIAGIHHVALYVGNGNVIQAPQSGSVVQITPWSQVSWGYLGATRPLT